MSTVSNVLPNSLTDAMNPAKKSASDSASAVQDRFMTLLVAQMKNQDPLNPMDNAQVTSQMAQLSTVTGIDKLNTALQALQASYQSSQALAATNLIGHGVLVPGSELALEDGKSIFGLELSSPVDNVKLTIRDASGRAVHEIDTGALDAGTVPLAWDGKTSDGADAADGIYSFEVSATRGGEPVNAATALTFGQVASVSTGASGVKLNVPGIGEVALGDVRQIL